MDFLRILCSVFVLISHLRTFPNTGFSSEFMSVGAIGVDFFFILSGYSMAAMFEKHSLKPAWPVRFLLNRFIRVCLPYFLALWAYLCVSEKSYISSEVLRSFLFLNSYSSDYSVWGLPVLPPGWSLNYEIVFYAALFLAGFYRRFFLLPIILVMAISTSIFVPHSYIWLELLMGYYTWVYREELMTINIPKAIRWGIVLLSVVVIISARKGAGDFISFSRILFWWAPAIFIFVLIFLNRRESGFFDALSKKHNFSFSLYLTHWIVLTWYSEQHHTSPLVLYSTLTGVTAFFYLCIERPAHHLSKRVIQ